MTDPAVSRPAMCPERVAHANDLRSCHYTPLKGLIAYQENRNDWEAMRAGYWRALAALDARQP